MSYLPSGGPCVTESCKWFPPLISPRQLTTYWQLDKVCHYQTVYKDMVFQVLWPPHSRFGMASIRGSFDLKGWNILFKELCIIIALRWYAILYHFNSHWFSVVPQLVTLAALVIYSYNATSCEEQELLKYYWLMLDMCVQLNLMNILQTLWI
jgi:hypothetical protein